MAKAVKRDYFWMECSECKNRNYRTDVNTTGGVPKLELKKYCKHDRRHTVHKLRKK